MDVIFGNYTVAALDKRGILNYAVATETLSQIYVQQTTNAVVQKTVKVCRGRDQPGLH